MKEPCATARLENPLGEPLSYVALWGSGTGTWVHERALLVPLVSRYLESLLSWLDHVGEEPETGIELNTIELRDPHAQVLTNPEGLRWLRPSVFSFLAPSDAASDGQASILAGASSEMIRSVATPDEVVHLRLSIHRSGKRTLTWMSERGPGPARPGGGALEDGLQWDEDDLLRHLILTRCLEPGCLPATPSTDDLARRLRERAPHAFLEFIQAQLRVLGAGGLQHTRFTDVPEGWLRPLLSSSEPAIRRLALSSLERLGMPERGSHARR